MKRWVIGDIHGNYKGLLQCLERSNFDIKNDLLVTLGDICDGYNQVYECVETLLSIPNRIDIRGNHDEWFETYFTTTRHGSDWKQGADATRNSYLKHVGKPNMVFYTGQHSVSAINPQDIPESHKQFFRNQVNYYVIDNFCFVHGGFDRHYPIYTQYKHTLYWDRYLWEEVVNSEPDVPIKTADNFSHIFIGHTEINGYKNNYALPITKCGVTNLDTGAGWAGKLTIMNIDTKEYFQSDFANQLYPEFKRT